MVNDIVNLLIESISLFGYPGIFLLMAMESSIFPVPSELVIPPAGYLVQQGLMNPWLVILAGTLGSLAGAYANYFAAHVLGRPFILRYGKYVLIPYDRFQRIERFFLQHGEISTFIGRLLPVVRHLISIPAGLAGMNHIRFTTYTLLGSFIWCSILTWIGYVIGRNQHLITLYYKQAVLGVGAGCSLLIALYIFRRRTRKSPIL